MAARDIVLGLKFRKQPEGFDANKLCELLEAAYLQQRRPDGYMQKKTFSPSGLAYGKGTCPRYWYLAFTGGEFVESVDALGVANMANGSAAHTRIEQLFEDAGILVSKEVEVKLSDPPVRGFADVLIRWEGQTVIGEIKTTRENAFMHRQSTMKPSANHLLQILLYMKGTGKDIGFLLYENKNDQTFLVIPVEWTEQYTKIYDDATNWMREVYKAYEDKTLPMRPFRSATTKVCVECPLNNECWNNQPDGDVKVAKMEIPKI